MKLIPNSFVDNYIALKEFVIENPNTIEEIGDRTFWQCGSLQILPLSSYLKYIGPYASYYCKGLETIYLPSTLETLGAESCEYWKNVKSIYCAAKIPPVCIVREINPDWTPFGKYGEDFVNRTPQDTPVYVLIGSADLYRNAWRWDYFTNFIETDNFPSSGIDSVAIDGKEEDCNYYDLLRRKAENPTLGNIYIHNGKKVLINKTP